MPVAFWFHLPSMCHFCPPPFSLPPQCQFHFLSVLIRLAMTFHLGGLTIKTSFLETWQQVALLLGRPCPEGTVCNTEPSSLTLPGTTVSRGPGGAPGAPEGMRRHGEAQDLPRPTIGDVSLGSRQSGLARRQGVRETAGAQVVFAKCLINRPGIVPTSRTVFSPASSFTWCLEQDVSCNYCLASLPLDPSLPTREVSLPRNHTSLLVPAALPSPPWLLG